MKSTTCLLAILSSCTLHAATPAPILQYDFNQGGLSENSKGSDTTPIQFRNAQHQPADMHGASGSGVTGAETDRALDTTSSSAMGADGDGGLAALKPSPVNGLKSFTICGWFKSDSDEFGNKARLFESTSGNNGVVVLAGMKPGSLGLMVNGQGVESPDGIFSGQGKWLFFAVTYDGDNTSSNVHFYQGSTETTASEAGSMNLLAGSVAETSSGATLSNSGGFQRPFKGLLDNFRFYGSHEDSSGALSEADIEAIRASDLKKP